MKTIPSFAKLSLVLLVIALVLPACASRMANSPNTSETIVEMERPVEAAAPPMEAGAASYDMSVLPADPERMVIKNANMTVVVVDPAASMDNITKLAEEMGGFVVSAVLSHSQLENGNEVPSASITIRVPAERFNDALQLIRAESDRLPMNENINSQDVTSDYTDLESRLRNLEAAEVQLTEIMGSATKTQDVLSVYNELVRVREQIEVIKGQMKYYEQSVALSSISTELLANEAVQPLTIGGWQPGGVVRQAIRTLINTLEALVNVIIWLALYLLPVLLALFIIFGLPLILIIWGIRSWRRRRQARLAPSTDKPQA